MTPSAVTAARLLAGALLLLGHAARAADAPPVRTLFVHASALNLRVKPAASARARAQVPIGTACDVLAEKPGGWAELKCPGGRGFARLDLLAEKAPEHAVYLGLGTDAARPASERINPLQRALALKPGDEPTRTAFRDTFYAAEFERLARARTARDTLKEPPVHDWIPECAESDLPCQLRGALLEDSAWHDVRQQGADVVLAMVFTDGLMRVLSLHRRAEPPALMVDLVAESVPSAEVIAALGGSIPGDQCQPQVPADSNPEGPGALCGHEFEQNCSPDECWDENQSCKESGAVECHECKLECGAGCTSCRQKCSGKSRADCTAACIQRMQTCANKCQGFVESSNTRCQRIYSSCADKAAARWEKVCARPCDKVHKCAGKRGGDPQSHASDCAREVNLPDECNERCMFGFQ